MREDAIEIMCIPRVDPLLGEGPSVDDVHPATVERGPMVEPRGLDSPKRFAASRLVQGVLPPKGVLALTMITVVPVTCGHRYNSGRRGTRTPDLPGVNRML